MNAIAQEAGVSKGTLYVYFKSKEELFEAIVEEQCARQAEQIFSFEGGGDVASVLTRVGGEFVRFLYQPGALPSLRTVIAIADRMPELGAKLYLAGPARGIANLTAYLEEQVAAGVLRAHDCRIAAAQFIDSGTYWMTDLTRDWDFWELFWPQLLRGVGLMSAMIPINNIALGTLPPERIKNASGLFNLTRNLGGAVGLAALTTILNDRTDLHLARLHDALTFAHRPALELLDDFAARYASFGSDARTMALKQLTLITHRQGVVMAFADVFLLITVLFLGLAFLALMMRRPAQLPASGGH
jgi:DHA2 family multidrug resistance protein